LGVGRYISYFRSPERQARRVVDRHLNAIRTGNTIDALETIAISKVGGISTDVFDFKYMNTLKKERVRDEPMVFDRERYEREVFGKGLPPDLKPPLEGQFTCYDEYLAFYKRIYTLVSNADRVKVTSNDIVVESEYYHYEFEFHYGIALTDKLGQRLYKQYVFEVKPWSREYAITGFHEM